MTSDEMLAAFDSIRVWQQEDRRTAVGFLNIELPKA